MDRDNDRVKWHDKARATNADCASFKLCLDFLLCRELTGRGPRGAVMGRALILSRKKLGKPTNLDFISMFLLFSMSD